VSKEPKHETCPKCGKYTLDYGPQGYRCLRVDCMWEGQLPMTKEAESILLSDEKICSFSCGYQKCQTTDDCTAFENHSEINKAAACGGGNN
jgi:hypothetical protein